MKKIAVAIAAIGLILALYAGTHRRAPDAAKSSPLPAVAPALTFVDLSGNRIETSSYKGKVLLINFWAAWCAPCAQEIPQFVALQNKYGRQGFQAIGISMDDPESALRDFYRKFSMNYPVVVGNQTIAQQYGGILGLPTTFLIARDGRIRAKYAGLADYPKLEQEIVALLE